MSAVVISVALLCSFSAWVTLHVALAFGLIRRSPRRWSLCWLLLPPLAWLAPYWGFQYRMRVLSIGWVVCALAYLVLLSIGVRWPEG